MTLTSHLRYRRLLFTTQPRRYVNLFRTIYERRCRRLVEIGTWNGVHAAQMIGVAAARAGLEGIRYTGFDLFEALTEAQFQQEFSKRPPAYDEVLRRLQETGADIRLVRGNTRATLPVATDVLDEADFVFIDGGHSIETITSDLNAVLGTVRPGVPVILDDYYVDPGVELKGLGCQSVIDALDRGRYAVSLLGPTDLIEREAGPLRIRMALVERRAA